MSDWIKLVKERPPVERIRFLEDNADDIREGNYYRLLDDEELDELRTANAQTDIELLQKKKELERVTEPIKARMKDLANAKKHTVELLKEKRQEMDGKLYVFHDADSNTTYELDQDGNIITQRQLAKKQRTTFQQSREVLDGTNS